MPLRQSRRLPLNRATLDPRTVDALTRLQLVKADLEAVSLKLTEIPFDQLSTKERSTWEQQVDKVDLAIARARSALLTSLSEAFKTELPQIESATEKLAQSLAKLNKASEVIDAVAGALGVLEKVIALGR